MILFHIELKWVQKYLLKAWNDITFNVATLITVDTTIPLWVYCTNIANNPLWTPGWAIWCGSHMTATITFINITLTISIRVTPFFALGYICVLTITPFVEIIFIACFFWYAATTVHACNLVLYVWKNGDLFSVSHVYIYFWYSRVVTRVSKDISYLDMGLYCSVLFRWRLLSNLHLHYLGVDLCSSLFLALIQCHSLNCICHRYSRLTIHQPLVILQSEMIYLEIFIYAMDIQ